MDITSYNIGDETGEQLIRDGNSEASRVVIAEVQHIRKAYANDKKDVHQLKQDVKKQLRELEQKITSHMNYLTADVQNNVEYIHENISQANVTLSEFINESISNISIFSNYVKKEIKELFENSSQQLTLQFNKTESIIKQTNSLTNRQNEDNIETFISLADRNVSEMMLKADNIFSLILTNFSEMPIQITNLLFEMQTTKHEVKVMDERLSYTIESTANELEKEIASMKICLYKEITNDGYYYPCAKNVRLAKASFFGATGVQGRLEVHHDNRWGTICDDSFQDFGSQNSVGNHYMTKNANVVCRMFGFRECGGVLKAGLGEGSGDILMDDVRCGGGESSFLGCPHRGWGVHDCGHAEDVGFRMWN
ncbi:uncharacterized protein LOC128222260 isoform X2 [Mya arenaria]|nr:uncharacterized protein LOC128222260 isoform X2 [Mya arenaria]